MGCGQSKPALNDAGSRDAPQRKQAVTSAEPPAPAPLVDAQAAAAVPLARLSPTSPLDGVDGQEDGMYKPDTETDRLQALLDCKCLDTPDERRFDNITTLLKDMFQVPMALVSLIDGERLWFKSVAGTDCRQGNRLHSFCDASLRAPNPTMMVVPDTLQDARFQGSQFVAGAPYVRFYSGAPLVSSDGHVLGSLGIMDVKPRSFPAGALNIICNFAELVVREMERDAAAAQRRLGGPAPAEAAALDAAKRSTVRALSCFDEAVMLCNTSLDRWPLLYVNEQWCGTTGKPEPSCLSSGLWELFPSASPEARAAAGRAIAARRGFRLAVEGPSNAGGRLVLELRPATRDHLSLAAPRIAIPNFVEGLEPDAQEALEGMYFAVAHREAAPTTPAPTNGSRPASVAGAATPERLATPIGSADHTAQWVDSSLSTSSRGSSSTFGLERPDELDGLVLGPMLGRGAVGKVYRGSWPRFAAGVAVKIMDIPPDTDGQQRTGPMVEALLSKKLHHPNIVQTLDFAVQPAEQQLWIVQQYCDRGTLGDALDRGWLRKSRAPGAGPNMRSVLATAQEIATAMQYLHGQGVLHGDLTPGNVLLAGSANEQDGGTAVGRLEGDTRGWAALVGDFGLSRQLDATAAIKTNTFGTVTHMPLELIQQQHLSKAVDVFAFGVLLWEMYSGKRAWAGKSAVQVLYRRTAGGERLTVPASWPAGYRALVEACLLEDHEKRPSFEEVAAKLSGLLAEAA